MAKYLDLQAAYKKTERVDWMPEEPRFRRGARVLHGGHQSLGLRSRGSALSRTFAGHGSDGLVRIENASLCGLERRAASRPSRAPRPSPIARTPGYFGIVNSEEAYQNLARFLFGDVRVDIWVDIDEHPRCRRRCRSRGRGKKVNALYQIEVLASPRGKLWFLTRRTAEEDSVACLTQAQWNESKGKRKSLYLSTVFLANRARVNPRRKSLAYSMTLGVRVPDYEVDRKLWLNEHYEGGYLFRNAVILEMVPPQNPGDKWKVTHTWQEQEAAGSEIDAKALKSGKVEVSVPFDNGKSPGVTGQLRFVISAWNPDAEMVE